MFMKALSPLNKAEMKSESQLYFGLIHFFFV